MNQAEEELRERLTFIAHKLFEEKLTEGTYGNISARIPNENSFLIKPSGYSFNELEPNFFIKINLNSNFKQSFNEKPSIETPMHLKLYKNNNEIGGVVHIHSKYATIFSVVNKEIIPMGLDVSDAPALVKGIGISKFAKPGSEELAENVLNSLKEKVATLLPHHGLTAIGKTIEEAAQNASVAEKMAKLHYEILLVGEPKELPKEYIEEMIKLALEKGYLI